MRRAFTFWFALLLTAACWLPMRAWGQTIGAGECCECAVALCTDFHASLGAPCIAPCVIHDDADCADLVSLGAACITHTPTETPTPTDTPTATPTSTPCSLVVTSTSDSGAGSLREAIDCANTQTGATISYAIAGAGQHDIDVASDLPGITANGTTIDCLTQGDSTCDPDALQNAVLRIRLVPSAPLNTGFSTGFSSPTGVTIRGCWWASATPPSGENSAFRMNGTNSVATCNRVDGWHGPQYATTGGTVNVLYDANVAANGDSEGFLIGLGPGDLGSPPTGTLTRNFCGTIDGVTGAGMQGGSLEGCITVRTVNGVTVSNNVIIGNNSHGILMQDTLSQGVPTNVTLSGNRVGVGITGLPLANAFDGIGVTAGTSITINGNNIVSANAGVGIHFGTGTTGNAATANKVGTNVAGANDPDFCNFEDQVVDDGGNTTTGNTVNADCVPHPVGCCALNPDNVGFSCGDSTTIGIACTQALCDTLNLPPPDGGGPGTCLYLSPGNNGACMGDFDGTCPAPEPTATPTASGPTATPTPCGDVGMATFRAVVADEAPSTTSIALTLGGGDVTTSDVCVAHIVTTANTAPPTPPSGDWAAILSGTPDGGGREVVYLATGIAPGVYTWTFGDSGDIYGAVACYINVDIANSPDFSFIQSNPSGTAHTTGAPDATFMDVLWVSLASAPTAITWTAPVEFSSRSTTSGAISGGVADAGLGAPGAYGPYTWTSSGATTSDILAVGLVPPCQPTSTETPTDTPGESPTETPTDTPTPTPTKTPQDAGHTSLANQACPNATTTPCWGTPVKTGQHNTAFTSTQAGTCTTQVYCERPIANFTPVPVCTPMTDSTRCDFTESCSTAKCVIVEGDADCREWCWVESWQEWTQ